MKKRKIGAGIFLILSIASAIAITWLARISEPRVISNQQKQMQDFVKKMVSDNTSGTTIETFTLLAPNYLKMGDLQSASRIFQGDKVKQVIYTAISERAYKDRIGMITAFESDCSIANVEIISQRETPGLGDQYKNNDFAWLKSLAGKSTQTNWTLKPKGDIDTWTGATVTPQAIIDTLNRMQQLCVHEHALLFSKEDPLYLEIGRPETTNTVGAME